jgi:cell division septum initiation protein DivIVA
VTLRSANRARLTPGRVRSMSFRLARLGRRGFDEDDVRDFCRQVEEELSLLLEERTALQTEVRRLRGWAQARNQGQARPALPPGAVPSGAVPSGAAPLGAPVALPSPSPPRDSPVAPRSHPVDLNDQALRILAKAQQTAERYVADAHAYSREVAHEAQRRREKILAEASAKATGILEYARQAAVRNRLAAGASSGRQPAALSAPPAPAAWPAPAAPPARTTDPDIYGDVAARHPGAAYDYRAPLRYDSPPAYNSDHRSTTDGPNSGAPADYSTVIDYPGPAADYRAPRPGYRDPARRGDGNSGRYRGHSAGDSRFPF